MLGPPRGAHHPPRRRRDPAPDGRSRLRRAPARRPRRADGPAHRAAPSRPVPDGWDPRCGRRARRGPRAGTAEGTTALPAQRHLPRRTRGVRGHEPVRTGGARARRRVLGRALGPRRHARSQPHRGPARARARAPRRALPLPPAHPRRGRPAAPFALWGDPASLRRGLAFYTAALPVARETAARQGCRGARWPKQIGPDLREAPSDIGPFLLWQQPHPIHLAELLRRADPTAAGDPDLAQVVETSVRCLVDLLRPDGEHLGLGPPLVGAQERHVEDRERLRDPSFELAYVAWALRIADDWRVRRGAP